MSRVGLEPLALTAVLFARGGELRAGFLREPHRRACRAAAQPRRAERSLLGQTFW